METYTKPEYDHIIDILSGLNTEISDFLFYFRGYPKDELKKDRLKYDVCGLDLIDVIIRKDY